MTGLYILILLCICLYAIYIFKIGYFVYNHILKFNKVKCEDIIVPPENIKIQPYVLRLPARYYIYDKIELPKHKRTLLDIIKLHKSKLVSNDEINVEIPVILSDVKYRAINMVIPLRISKVKSCNSDSITTEIIDNKPLECGRRLLTLRYMSNVFHDPENHMRMLFAVSYIFIEPETT